MPESRRTRRTRRRGSRDVRGTLLEAAEKLLGERPLSELSVEAVLQDAGVSRASFYFYFESKHAIVAALLERIIDEIHAASLPWFERGDTPPAEALREALTASLAVWRRHAAVLRAGVENWVSVPELREVWGGLIARFTDAAAAQIERDRKVGIAPAGPDARRLAAVLIAMNERSYHFAVSEGDPADDPALVETLATVWLASVYGEVSGKPAG